MTESIDKIRPHLSLQKAKRAQENKTASLSSVKQKDQISLSPQAKIAMEKKRFVDHLISMPEMRSLKTEKEYDYSSPKIFREMAKKLLEEGF